MGCGASKAEDSLPLVVLCRQRKELLKSAADHRFGLAAAHLAYFRQLRHVGESLCRFVEEELILSSSSSSASSSSLSSLSSPVLTLPSDVSKKKTYDKTTAVSSSDNSTSVSSHHHHHKDDSNNSHLHWSSSSSGHLDIQDEEDELEDHKKHIKGRKKKKKKNLHKASAGDDNYAQPQPKPQPQPRVQIQPGIQYIPDPEPPIGTHVLYPPYPTSSTFDPSFYPSSFPNIYPPSPFYNSNPIYNNSDINHSYPAPTNFDYNDSANNYQDGNYTSYGGGTTYNTYYMKKSSTQIPSVIFQEPKYNPIYTFSHYPGDPNSNSNSNSNSNYSPSSPSRFGGNSRPQQQQRQSRAPTPPAPNVSAWDYFNPFETFESTSTAASFFYPEQPGYSGYEEASNSSSPDSREVREREGIPELEEETESEVTFSTKVPKSKHKTVQFRDHPNHTRRQFSETSTKTMPNHHPQQHRPPDLEPEPVEVNQGKGSSPETETSIATATSIADEDEEEEEHEHDHDHDHDDMYVKKKGVSFEFEAGAPSSQHLPSSTSSKPTTSLTTLSADGTRDLKEVVREIKDEFEAATDYGNQVSVLLEVGKEPYRSHATFLKVMLAKVCSGSLSSSHSPSSLGAAGFPEEDLDSRSLASTLEKLYVWEKKLYKEVKDEERLRIMYEKQCKKLKALDEQGAETSKVEATQLSIRKLLTRINVSVRAVDSISSRIHKLRDEELQPQLKELIYGLRKMWKLMLKCHQKQFQAILESKTRALKANTGLRRDSSVRATIQLEADLLKWCHRFNNWVEMQRSYTETLNGWLEKCIHYEPEVTPDGVVPFSPGQIGAPPVFVICHDWKQAMERVSESEVQTAMNDFATSLHQLWERQDEEQRRRLKAENMYKDFEKQIRSIKMDKQRKGHDHDDVLSDKNSLSMVASESGISPLDDLKVDLDSMRQRVREERAGHKEAIKLVHDAVSRTIQAGLVPIFEALESFTSEASKAFEDVRLEHVSASA